jgi:hypothetical protein
VAWATAAYSGGRDRAWQAVTGAGGCFGTPGLAGGSEGGRFDLPAPGGPPLSGRMITWRPPRQFVGEVASWNDGLMRVEVEGSEAKGNVWLWMAVYGIAEEWIAGIKRAWRERLAALLG